jgi:hypothetical protein
MDECPPLWERPEAARIYSRIPKIYFGTANFSGNGNKIARRTVCAGWLRYLPRRSVRVQNRSSIGRAGGELKRHASGGT